MPALTSPPIAHAGITARALALAAIFVPFLALPAVGQNQDEAAQAVLPEPVIAPALDGVFEAFETHPLVGLGERHGVAQMLDFYKAIIRDPRFASEVGHVVVEFGGAAHQDVIDRYVNGENVSYEELRNVWRDTVGWSPAVIGQGYARFFSTVRMANLTLEPENRIKVWLGEPPIDWSTITTREQYETVLATRDSHAASVIVDHILTQGQKALIIYGGAHFDRTAPWENQIRAELAAAVPDGPFSGEGDATLRDIIEADYPNNLFVAQAYAGFQDAECTRRFEETIPQWPALAVSVRGTALERGMRECLVVRDPSEMRLPPVVPEDVQARVRAIIEENADDDRPLLADSILFYAPADELVRDIPMVEVSMDEEWRVELNRRNEIMNGRPLPPDWGLDVPSTPAPFEGRD